MAGPYDALPRAGGVVGRPVVFLLISECSCLLEVLPLMYFLESLVSLQVWAIPLDGSAHDGLDAGLGASKG